MRKIMVLAIGALCAFPAAAGQKAAKIAITPASPNAAVVIKAPALRTPPGYKSAYKINLESYDPVNRQMRGGPFAGTVTIAAQPQLFAGDYLVADLKPGTYVLRDFSRQDHWALCFNGNSVQFTVRPGEVLYLGSFDAQAQLGELQRQATMSGRLSTTGAPVHFFDIAPPVLLPAGEADLAPVAAMMKAAMPGTTVAPRAAALTPARFGTGRDLFGLSRICGGYYAGKAK